MSGHKNRKYECNHFDCPKDYGDVYGENCEKCGNWYCKYHPGHIIDTLCIDCHSKNGDTEFVERKSTEKFDNEIEQIRERCNQMHVSTAVDPDMTLKDEVNEETIIEAKKDIKRLLEILDSI